MKQDKKIKTIFITGSNMGIGKETALKFAREGCNLAITYYKDRDEAFEVFDECRRLGAKEIQVVQLNLVDDQSIRLAVGRVIERFGEISVLINNAGVVVWKPLSEQSFENIEQQVRINIEGLIKVTRACLPYVKDSIINIVGGAGMEGMENLVTYCTTKFAVRGFTEALAKEQPEIKVLAINEDPGSGVEINVWEVYSHANE